MGKRNEICYKLGINARKVLENTRNLLVVDEDPKLIHDSFEKFGIPNTLYNRCKFRELILSTKGLNKYIGGIILSEEAFIQKDDQENFIVDMISKKNILPGIKLDKGVIDFRKNEKVSVGLEDLEKRLRSESISKAELTKWRSVFIITDKTPTDECINENCSVLARYAKICQKCGKVPIVEPEVLWEGNYTIDHAYIIAKKIFSCLVYHMNLNDVYLPGILLKISFIIPGKDNTETFTFEKAVEKNISALNSTIPVGVAGILFSSGAYLMEDIQKLLHEIKSQNKHPTWKLSLSHKNGFSNPVLNAWLGRDKNIETAQEVFLNLLKKIDRLD
ncbi:hypothetical protein EDEG_00074 [Edhazardia aedis USNM 41457]|uniref:fructose-bisphosphate aldolase n=1 Tax=Edhazardia aedis (strain USNM 41457) TaxID=1003232 RepID=J9DUI0_EDHAE|nr:hypothetical protein EDEG_00074 [Edhazardia aedis USNM 41457]|eukprot:EJW04957.1 hypothetical protein EDEG_00074 [Edhazardia aedis USNM 41457]